MESRSKSKVVALLAKNPEVIIAAAIVASFVAKGIGKAPNDAPILDVPF